MSCAARLVTDAPKLGLTLQLWSGVSDTRKVRKALMAAMAIIMMLASPTRAHAAPTCVIDEGDHGIAMRQIVADQAPDVPVWMIDASIGGVRLLSTVSQRVDECVAGGANVISLSLAAGTSTPTWEQAIARARESGVLVFAATGNQSISGLCGGTVCVTALAPGAVAVSAIDDNGQLSPLALPGPALLYGPDEAEGWAGTSPATAYVAGVAAAVRARAPQLSASAVQQILVSTARPARPGPAVDRDAALEAVGARPTRATASPRTRSAPPRARARKHGRSRCARSSRAFAGKQRRRSQARRHCATLSPR
jgi:hypothetical protein